MVLGVGMIVTMFLLKGGFLVEQMLDHCACMCPLNLSSYIGVYLITWFTVNSVQD